MNEMPSYDDVLRRAKGRPFANSTEGDAWVEAWCLRPGAPCRHDEMERHGEGKTCPLLDVVLMEGKTPAEWTHRRPGRLGREMYRCTLYEPER